MGRLVYKRIKAKAENRSDEMYDDIEDGNHNNESKKAIVHEWNSDDVRDSAKATCRNWFLKSSIRELVPRLYRACAFRLYALFASEPPVDRLNKINYTDKGVGDR